MPEFAYARVGAGQPMPGSFVVPDRMAVRQVIEELLLVEACSEQREHDRDTKLDRVPQLTMRCTQTADMLRVSVPSLRPTAGESQRSNVRRAQARLAVPGVTLPSTGDTQYAISAERSAA
jgi:hypothetical protein